MKIYVALNICLRRIKDIDDLIKESLAHFTEEKCFMVSDNEWQILTTKFDKKEVLS